MLMLTVAQPPRKATLFEVKEQPTHVVPLTVTADTGFWKPLCLGDGLNL